MKRDAVPQWEIDLIVDALKKHDTEALGKFSRTISDEWFESNRDYLYKAASLEPPKPAPDIDAELQKPEPESAVGGPVAEEPTDTAFANDEAPSPLPEKPHTHGRRKGHK